MAKEENVTRIKASDDSPKKRQKKDAQPEQTTHEVTKVVAASPKAKTPRTTRRRKAVFGGPLGAYLKGAWKELRLVRWPNRRATWSMTLAVILFSAAFGLVILLLDILFKYLFDFMIK